MFQYIRGMSQDRKYIHDQLVYAAGNVDEHLIKLCLYPDSLYVNHWKSEVASFLSRCPKVNMLS